MNPLGMLILVSLMKNICLTLDLIQQMRHFPDKLWVLEDQEFGLVVFPFLETVHVELTNKRSHLIVFEVMG